MARQRKAIDCLTTDEAGRLVNAFRALMDSRDPHTGEVTTTWEVRR